MMSNEFRATVSNGLIRPPTRTGSLPKLTRSGPSLPCLGGIKAARIQAPAKSNANHGKYRFMREERGAGGKTRRGDIQIGPADRPRQRYRPHKARGSSDSARLAELKSDRPAQILPGNRCRRGTGAGD